MVIHTDIAVRAFDWRISAGASNAEVDRAAIAVIAVEVVVAVAFVIDLVADQAFIHTRGRAGQT